MMGLEISVDFPVNFLNILSNKSKNIAENL